MHVWRMVTHFNVEQATSAAAVTTDRFCVATYEKLTHANVRIGTADLLECCFTCAPNGGCDGATLGRVWNYLKDVGVAVGVVHPADYCRLRVV